MVTAVAKMIGGALGLVNKGMDKKAGVDAQRSVNLEKTLEVQQRVDDAPARLDNSRRDVNFDDWLHSEPGSLPSKAAGGPMPDPPTVHKPTDRH